ncbi:MAG: GatB/YqeY domain-containing protein [Tenuifilaceae bacterium]
MSLEEKINNDIKAAMMAKEKIRLEALRAVKSAILIAKTEKGHTETISADVEMKLLQKQVKQRKESADIYKQQNRPELAEKELAEAAVIEEYLPKMLSEVELIAELKKIIDQVGAKAPSDMGKVMGVASKALAGKADGKLISEKVKALLAG